MVVQTILLTVVTPTHQVTPAPSIIIIPPSITSSLPFTTGLSRGAAPSTIVVTPSTPLTWRRRQWYPWYQDRAWPGGGDGGWLVTTVVFLIVVKTKLLAIVAPTHKAALATTMTI